MPATHDDLAEEDPHEGAMIEAASFVLALRARGVRDTAVLRAMELVPRELFAPRRFADLARSDVALPLAGGQTMTAPGTVAALLVELAAEPGQRVLEIGTGTGYVTALLCRLGLVVHSIERQAMLAESAGRRLETAGLAGGVTLTTGDGLALAQDDQRFQRILVNGAVSAMPAALTSRLAVGGRLVGALAGERLPRIVRITRGPDGSLDQHLGAQVRLAPLVERMPR